MIEWVPIEGFSDRYVISRDGQVKNIRTGKIRQPRINKGYLCTWLSMGKRGHVKCIAIHTLMARAFIGPRPEGMQVNHKDGVKTNNAPENLEYVTPSENTRHAWAFGLSKKRIGERVPSSKLTAEEVVYIKSQRGKLRCIDLASQFKVHQSNISHIWAGDSWGHV